MTLTCGGARDRRDRLRVGGEDAAPARAAPRRQWPRARRGGAGGLLSPVSAGRARSLAWSPIGRRRRVRAALRRASPRSPCRAAQRQQQRHLHGAGHVQPAHRLSSARPAWPSRGACAVVRACATLRPRAAAPQAASAMSATASSAARQRRSAGTDAVKRHRAAIGDRSITAKPRPGQDYDTIARRGEAATASKSPGGRPLSGRRRRSAISATSRCARWTCCARADAHRLRGHARHRPAARHPRHRAAAHRLSRAQRGAHAPGDPGRALAPAARASRWSSDAGTPLRLRSRLQAGARRDRGRRLR